VGFRAVGHDFEILVVTGECVIAGILWNQIAVLPEDHGDGKERLCVADFATAEQVCGCLN
jgi:hypothetical protein